MADMTETRPAWWPTAENKRHADAGCAHPDRCNVEQCGAQYGKNPDPCHMPAGHPHAHTNQWGTTWAAGRG